MARRKGLPSQRARQLFGKTTILRLDFLLAPIQRLRDGRFHTSESHAETALTPFDTPRPCLLRFVVQNGFLRRARHLFVVVAGNRLSSPESTE